MFRLWLFIWFRFRVFEVLCHLLLYSGLCLPTVVSGSFWKFLDPFGDIIDVIILMSDGASYITTQTTIHTLYEPHHHCHVCLSFCASLMVNFLICDEAYILICHRKTDQTWWTVKEPMRRSLNSTCKSTRPSKAAWPLVQLTSHYSSMNYSSLVWGCMQGLLHNFPLPTVWH